MLNKYTAVALLSVCSFFISISSAFAFGPCQWAWPKEIAYYPTAKVCGGKAAVAVTGRYINSFSIVARDCANGDRDPCHRQVGGCGTNASSPFKVQKIVRASVERESDNQVVEANIHCLKEAGTSQVYRLLVRRITIKVRNPVRSSSDILKLCLPNRGKIIHPMNLVKVRSQRVPADTLGITPACYTQGYLNCPYQKSHLCVGR